MTKTDIEDALIESIREIQEMSGRSTRGITASSVPLRDIDGFDSLNAVEALCNLSKKLKREFKGDINLFAPKAQRNMPVSLRDIVNNVAVAIGLGKE